jgi:hypothetical protein
LLPLGNSQNGEKDLIAEFCYHTFSRTAQLTADSQLCGI